MCSVTKRFIAASANGTRSTILLAIAVASSSSVPSDPTTRQAVIGSPAATGRGSATSSAAAGLQQVACCDNCTRVMLAWATYEIYYRYRGNKKIFDKPAESVIVGRPRHGVQVDIDLTPDLRVSRPHARIWVAEDHYWIEDLGSANGTEVDGQPIKGVGKVRLEPGHRIQMAITTFEVDIPAGKSQPEPSWSDDRNLGRHP